MIDQSLAGTANYDPRRDAIVQALLAQQQQQQQQQGGPQSGPGWETFNGPMAFAGGPAGDGGGVPGTANYRGGIPAGGFPVGFRGRFNPNAIVGENPMPDYSGDPDAGSATSQSASDAVTGGHAAFGSMGNVAAGNLGIGGLGYDTGGFNASGSLVGSSTFGGPLGHAVTGSLANDAGLNDIGVTANPSAQAIIDQNATAFETSTPGLVAPGYSVTPGLPGTTSVANPSPSVSISISTPGNPSVSLDPGGSITGSGFGGDAGNASGVVGGEGVGGVTGFGGTVGQGMGFGADVGMGGSDAGSGGVGGAAVGSAGDTAGGPSSGDASGGPSGGVGDE